MKLLVCKNVLLGKIALLIIYWKKKHLQKFIWITFSFSAFPTNMSYIILSKQRTWRGWVVRITNKGGCPPMWKLLCELFLPNIYTMKVHVAWEHSNFKNVDLVAIQYSDPQARICNWPIFDKLWYFPPKSSEGYKKLKQKD